MKIRAFVEADADGVVELWDRCGLLRPWNDPRKDIARKLEVQRELRVSRGGSHHACGIVRPGRRGRPR